MRTIWKFQIPLLLRPVLLVPRGARFLSAQPQPIGAAGPMMVAWFQVDTVNDPVPLQLVIVGTGNPIPLDDPGTLTFLATVQVGAFVWHLFQEEQARPSEPDRDSVLAAEIVRRWNAEPKS